VTVNIFPHNKDLLELEEHIALLKDIQPDGIILSDPGLFQMIKKNAPEIALHMSTQTNITNLAAARFWEEQGAKRIVLSRELSIEEIRDIRKKTQMELEVFVHGSICISYSGRCYISSFLSSRSANTGECSNSCRWNYTLMEEKRPGEFFPVFEDDRGTYLMSSRDLCMIEHLSLLAEAGIDSFKIEGRMKGVNFVAGVSKVYREAIDLIGRNVPDRTYARWFRELSMFSSRGYTTGMFFGKQPDHAYNFDENSYRMSHELVGISLEKNGSTARVGLRNRLDTGDRVEYLSPGIEGQSYTIESMNNAHGIAIPSARNEDTIYMQVPKEVRKDDLVRREKDLRNTAHQPQNHREERMRNLHV
jgi:putative protease